ncbi:nuclear transport factor 2 family protein [Jatrophihabitans sp. DSM 45814]
MTPLETARRYVELFNAGQYAEMGALFAEDSVWRPPPPAPEVHGGPAIKAGYSAPEQAERSSALQIAATRYLVDGSTVVAELVFSADAHAIEVVDIFDVDEDGKITCMTAYTRSAPR